MKASIIITTFNNGQHIEEAINSVMNQSLKDWNCIIVDNNSTDHTFEVINNKVKSDDRFFVFKKENEGPSAARNLGFSNLPEEPEYIHFLDGDDKLEPKFLEILTSYLDVTNNVGLVGCQYNIIDSKGNFLGPGHRSRYAAGFLGIPISLSSTIKITPFETFFSSTGQGPFAVFRTSVYKETSGYEINFWSHEDSDIFCQMALKSEVHYLPYRLYNKRIHENNLTYSPKANYELFREKWDNFKSSDRITNLLIEKSLKYYYTRHKPLRDFKVAIKAFNEFIFSRKLEKLKWASKCFKSGLFDLFFKKNLVKILKQRSN